MLPGFHHTGDINAKAVWAGQGAQEVQVGGAEGSNRPIGAAAEDEVISDAQTGGLSRLRTHGQVSTRTCT